MKHRLIYAALAMLALAAPNAAVAQGFELGALPPYEILTILRSTGMEPAGQLMRRGPNYVIRAFDDADREVRVVIAARSGDILSVTPVGAAPQMPPRGGYTRGPYERMPPGYVPPGAYRPGAPGADDDDDAPPPRDYRSRPPGAIPGPLPRSSNAVPAPRGGAMAPDDDDEVSPPSGPRVIPADPDRSAMLPPPPERFPQRAAPPAPPKPKPVTRAATAPPKAAPLPKPKPAGDAAAAAPQLPPSKAWSPQPDNPPAPAKTAPASDETPH